MFFLGIGFRTRGVKTSEIMYWLAQRMNVKLACF
jgi:hypothetical protein